jgi:hypothetical protein
MTFQPSKKLLRRIWLQPRVYTEVTQLSDFFVTTTISLHAKLLLHRDVLFFLYGVCRLPLVKCKLRTMIYYHWLQHFNFRIFFYLHSCDLEQNHLIFVDPRGSGHLI